MIIDMWITARGANSTTSHKELIPFSWNRSDYPEALLQCVLRAERDGTI